MKLVGGIIGVIILGVIALLMFGGSSDTKQNDTGSDFAAVQSAITNGGRLIDVRTAEEYAESHITDASNLSLQDIQAGSLPEVDKTASIFVYCRSGNRSAQATALLKEAGYTNITDLGAMTDVVKMGGTLVE